ncbi:MAG: Crp/Fnr family transcriptional regulator [Acidiferrobacter sp.]
MVTRAEGLNSLIKSTLFKGLDDDVFNEMADGLTPEHWARRTPVWAPREAATRFRIVLRGRVKVTRKNPTTGREVTLFLLGPGDVFNVVSLLDGEPHAVQAETLDAVDALSGPTALWHTWLARYPRFRRNFGRYVSCQLQHLSDMDSDLALHDTMTRLARLILRHYGKSDPDHSPHLNLIQGLPHEEIAHMIGTVRIVVNRLLGEFKREGILESQGRILHVRNLQKLLQKAEVDLQHQPASV